MGTSKNGKIAGIIVYKPKVDYFSGVDGN